MSHGYANYVGRISSPSRSNNQSPIHAAEFVTSSAMRLSPRPQSPNMFRGANPNGVAATGSTSGFGNGSLRSTRSSANAYTRGDYNMGQRSLRGNVQRRPQGIMAFNNLHSDGASEHISTSQEPTSLAQLHPYVPDVGERRAVEVPTSTKTIDYNYNYPNTSSAQGERQSPIHNFSDIDHTKQYNARRHRLDDKDNVLKPNDYADDSIQSIGDRLSTYEYQPTPGETRQQDRPFVGNARLMNGHGPTYDEAHKPPAASRVLSQRVEFGYTSPAMHTMATSGSPENDEIADIIADMRKTRVSPSGVINLDDDDEPSKKKGSHIYLQLCDDIKRAEFPEELSQLSLINLFIEKYRTRLADSTNSLPSVYIKDPKRGVFYELEDMSDVVDGSILSWHTQPIKPTEPEQIQEPADENSTDNGNSSIKIELESLSEIVKSLSGIISQLPAQIKTEVTKAIEEVKSTSTSISLAPSKPKIQGFAKSTPISRTHSSQELDLGITNIVRENGELQETLKRLERAELALSVERQERREALKAAEEEKAGLQSELDKLKKDVENHPNVLRTRIEEGKKMLKSEYREMNTRFEDVHMLILEMRKDVTQRGSMPSTNLLNKASSELKAIEEGSEKLKKFINETRSDWKHAWQEELQNILNEQAFVKNVEQLLGELLDDTHHMDDVLGKLEKIVEFKVKERARDGYIPPASTKFLDVATPDEAKDVKRGFLMEISCVDVDHDRRLEALKAAEKLRQQELASKVNEFDKELSDFVGQRKLRRTGGTEELERKRAEKDAEVMKDMLKSVEEAELERRAKIAQRKAAKKSSSKTKPAKKPKAQPDTKGAVSLDEPSPKEPSVEE